MDGSIATKNICVHEQKHVNYFSSIVKVNGLIDLFGIFMLIE